MTSYLKIALGFASVFAVPTMCYAQAVPANIVADGVPTLPADLISATSRYTEARSASFSSWGPQGSMIISTRFGATAQLHRVSAPGAARTQLTFAAEPIAGASWAPKARDILVYVKDNGGDEYFQFYALNKDGSSALLTDGKSRNSFGAWSDDGVLVAYSSTRRTGKDTDIYIMDPRNPKTDKLVLERTGGGWGVSDFSPDKKKLLLAEYISINQSNLYDVDIASGAVTPLTSQGKIPTSYGGGKYMADGRILTTSDKGSEWRRLILLDPKTGAETPLISNQKWDIEDYDLSPDQKTIVYTQNEDGFSAVRLLTLSTNTSVDIILPQQGTVSGLDFNDDGTGIAFTLGGSSSPGDAYVARADGTAITRWTTSEVGPLDAQKFVEPKLLRWRSFDKRDISAVVYRPDPAKFPGPRPVIINIHGGPEGQSRPGFQGRNNYLINELGITIVYPNVRGSEGYGKTFLKLDNGFSREDSVRDIGALIETLKADTSVDAKRIAVTGGSYGGYMTLAAMTFYADKLRAGIEIVGISNFVTFLKNTNPYRVDLRRVEYGDERIPKMNAFLQKISPLTNVAKINIPLMVVTGANDPRVPASEAEQVVAAVRKQGGAAWHVLAKDEGHGFRKKANQDYQFWASVLFWQQNLLK
jgi:dipeptidyl aminopeptidase/acylaminoacyl peptidase